MKLERDLKLETYYQRVSEEERLPKGSFMINFNGFCDHPPLDLPNNDWTACAIFKDCNLVRTYIDKLYKLFKTAKDPETQYENVCNWIDDLVNDYCNIFNEDTQTYGDFWPVTEDDDTESQQNYPISFDIIYCDEQGRMYEVQE